MKQLELFALFALLLVFVNGQGVGPGLQQTGYVTVRPGAHMFWWLYHTTANVTDSADRPLIIWLSGGPGSSSTGTGNFWYVGPLDINLQPREYTWVKDFNVLFIDNPVGTGFSYVENLRFLANNNEEIASDLVALTKGFFEAVPKFKNTPLYIYGISYGGKMATDFSLKLHQAIKAGEIECNFKSVALGNPWISPIVLTQAYGDLVYEMSLIDSTGRDLVNEQARFVKEVFEKGDFFRTRVEWVRTIELLDRLADGIDIYNLLAKIEKPQQDGRTFEERLMHSMAFPKHDFNELFFFMNGPVRQALNIPNYVVWSSQMLDVQLNLYVEFMMPVTSSVERLLNETDLDVHVCNGNFDLIVSTPGTIDWINKLSWPGSEVYKNAPRTTVWVNDTMEGYKQEGGKFHFYWINAAGHIAPEDSPAGTRAFWESITGV